jgi:hypothetical protein
LSANALQGRHFAPNLPAMYTRRDRIRTAWACRKCQLYRRAAVVLCAMAACSWFFL